MCDRPLGDMAAMKSRVTPLSLSSKKMLKTSVWATTAKSTSAITDRKLARLLNYEDW